MGWDGLLTYGLICNNESTQNGYLTCNWGLIPSNSFLQSNERKKNNIQKLITPLEHLSLPPVFSFLCNVLQIVVYPFPPIFFWPLYYMSFFDLRFLVTLWHLQTFLMLVLIDDSSYYCLFVQLNDFLGPQQSIYLVMFYAHALSVIYVSTRGHSECTTTKQFCRRIDAQITILFLA